MRAVRAFSLVLLLGFAAAAVPVAALDVALEYRTADPSRTWFPGGTFSSRLSATAPSGTWKFPAFNSRFPLYAQVRMGDQTVLLIFDRQSPQSAFYDLVYVDANGNGDLTDDPKLIGETGKPSAAAVHTIFKPLETTVISGGKQLPYSMKPYIYCWDSGRLVDSSATAASTISLVSWYIQSAAYYQGRFSYNGKSYTVTLGDYNTDGVFATAIAPPYGVTSDGKIYTGGDWFCLTEGQGMDSLSLARLGRYLAIGTSLFEVSIDIPGRKMSLSPVSGGTTLQLPRPTQMLVLAARDASGAVMAYYAADSVRIPSGSYVISSYSVRQTDKAGDVWILQAAGGSKASYFDVASSGPLSYGPPFTPRVFIYDYYRNEISAGRRSDCPLNFQVVGKNGEVVTAFQRLSGRGTQVPMSTKNASLPAEPTYMILLSTGEVAAKGAFEYG